MLLGFERCRGAIQMMSLLDPESPKVAACVEAAGGFLIPTPLANVGIANRSCALAVRLDGK